jgi:RND family efflux transporter MFP subunit
MKLHPVSRRPSLLLVALAALPLACQQKPPEEETSPPAPVQAMVPRALVLGQWTELDGTTQPLPQHAARVSAAVEGRVASVLTGEDGKPVHEGQLVHAGDIIVRLDDRIVRANRDKVEAGLKDLEEQRKQAVIAVDLAQIEVKRLQELMNLSASAGGGAAGGRPLVTQVEMERARLAVKDAESKQAAAVARQEGAAKEVKAYDEQLALFALRAPITGRLGLLQVMPGQTLTVGAPVADVVDLDEIEALCYVAPHTRARLAPDQPARIVRTKENGQPDVLPTDGKVVFLAPQAQPETGNFAVKMRFPNKGLRVLANTVVRVQVETQPEKERLTIPEDALLEDQDPPTVVVIDKLETKKNAEGKEEKSGVARRLQATVGVRDREWHVVEILALKDPDKKGAVSVEDALIITKGANGLRDGDAVRIAEEDDDEK